jgi:hypothetical protein
VEQVSRLQMPLARARQLVENLERRQQEHAAAVAAGDQAAAARLVETFSAGTEAPPVADVIAPETLAGELRTARLARARLVAADRAARDLLQRRTHGVARCAHGVLVAEAVELAEQVIGQAAELARRRADLAAAMPSPISRALYGVVNAALADPEIDWRPRYDLLQREGTDLSM